MGRGGRGVGGSVNLPSARRQAAVLDVVTRHAVGPSSPRAAPSAADLVPSATRALPPSPAPTSPGAERRAGSGAGVVRIECAFAGGPAAVEVRAAPPKAAARMREKLCEYAPPHPAATWPLCGNILDPVRASVVCSGAAQMLEVIIAARRRQPGPHPSCTHTPRRARRSGALRVVRWAWVHTSASSAGPRKQG